MISGREKLTFTSYVNCVKPLNEEETILHLKLLSGEIATVSADGVMITPTTKAANETNGTFGKLFVTNFRLSFLPYDTVYEHASFQGNRFLRRNDVTLSNIDTIYQIVDKKKKRILPQQEVNSKIDSIFVICKNFRFFKFSFKTKDQGTLIASALARFAFPSRHDLSFAFYYNDTYFNNFQNDVTMFNTKNDWICELKRCGATEWKVMCADSITTLSENLQTGIKPYYLPKYCVIPKCFNEKDFFLSTNAFCDSRSAFWVYSYGPTSASLVRMGELKSYQKGRTIENITLEKVRNCDPNRKSLAFKNLSEQFLPSMSDIRQSYLKLRELCTPDSFREFLMQDSKYCSSLDKSGWLKCVSTCLKFSLNISEFLRLGTTVVLQEANAREMCCVISSITQILLDPYFRTFNGFQSLIQKEWVALEHPFSNRLGHTWKPENIGETRSTSGSKALINNFVINSGTSTDEESPLLLLFLDCIWQLLQQYPEEFEFSQIYLTTIWDSAFMPIFDTFQFNCEYDRDIAVMEKKLILRPVWNWNEQFDEKNKNFFFNPLYLNKPFYTMDTSLKQIKNKTTVMLKDCENITSSDIQNHNSSTIPYDRFLEPLCGVSDLKVWQQCYYRWIPILEVERGGFPQIDLLNRLLIYNISKLEKELDSSSLFPLYSGKQRYNSDLSGCNVNKKTIKKSGNEEMNTDLMKSEVEIDVKKKIFVIKSGKNAVNKCSTNIPVVNSFFPFGVYNGNSSDINDILVVNNEIFLNEMAVDHLVTKKISD